MPVIEIADPSVPMDEDTAAIVAAAQEAFPDGESDATAIDQMFGEKAAEPTMDEIKQRVSELLDGVQVERTLTRTCLDIIPTDRLAELGQTNAQIVQQIQDMEEEASRISKSFKARIATLENDIRERSRKIRSGHESVDVECRELFDRTYGRAYIERIDTGEIIEVRPLSARESQLYMQLEPEDNELTPDDDSDDETDSEDEE